MITKLGHRLKRGKSEGKEEKKGREGGGRRKREEKKKREKTRRKSVRNPGDSIFSPMTLNNSHPPCSFFGFGFGFGLIRISLVTTTI